MSTAVTAQDVKALRDRTGAGIMDAKSALQESGGDVDKAALSLVSVITVMALRPAFRLADTPPPVAAPTRP